MVAELATHTETLLTKGTKIEGTNAVSGRELNGDSCDVDQDHSIEGFSLKRAFCQDLEKRGLVQLLSSGEPEQLGFTFEWYRHTS